MEGSGSGQTVTDPVQNIRVRYAGIYCTRKIIFLPEVILFVCAAAGRPAVQGEGQPGPHAGRSA
jgi:hypothetical protein